MEIVDNVNGVTKQPWSQHFLSNSRPTRRLCGSTTCQLPEEPMSHDILVIFGWNVIIAKWPPKNWQRKLLFAARWHLSWSRDTFILWNFRCKRQVQHYRRDYRSFLRWSHAYITRSHMRCHGYAQECDKTTRSSPKQTSRTCPTCDSLTSLTAYNSVRLKV